MTGGDDIAGDARGFTLIEVLVAIAVTAIMMGSVGVALRLMADAAARGSREVDRVDMVSRGLAVLRRDLARMERAVISDRSGLRFVFDGDGGAMRFVAVDPGYPSTPGTYLISYAVRTYRGGAQVVRTRDVFDPGGSNPRRRRDESEEVTVLEGPYRFEIAYLPPEGQPQRWTNRWTNVRTMPRMVRIEGASLVRGIPPIPPLVVRLRIDAEITCLGDNVAQPCTPRTGALITPPRGTAEGGNPPREGSPGATR